MAKSRDRWRFVLDSSIGEPNVPTRCALVKDIKDMYPELRRPHVTQWTISFTDENGVRLVWNTSLEVARWICKFDRGENPAPLAVILHRRDASEKDHRRKPILVSSREKKAPKDNPAHEYRGIRRR